MDMPVVLPGIDPLMLVTVLLFSTLSVLVLVHVCVRMAVTRSIGVGVLVVVSMLVRVLVHGECLGERRSPGA